MIVTAKYVLPENGKWLKKIDEDLVVGPYRVWLGRGDSAENYEEVDPSEEEL